MQRQGGFSLIELSIVLVIIGLLAGGILAGQSLIRAAELRSVTNDLSRYKTALYTFRDKYFALPGDMSNATKFWGASATCPGSFSNPTTGTDTCDGDGDGNIYGANWLETYRAWQHLANAGIVEGHFTGVPATAAAPSIQIGANIPTSRIANSGYTMQRGVDVGGVSWFPSSYGNVIEFGTSTGGWNAGPSIPSEDTWNMDTKLDDGLPGTGTIMTFTSNVHPLCASTTVPSTAAYVLTGGRTPACHLIMKTGT